MKFVLYFSRFSLSIQLVWYARSNTCSSSSSHFPRNNSFQTPIGRRIVVDRKIVRFIALVAINITSTIQTRSLSSNQFDPKSSTSKKPSKSSSRRSGNVFLLFLEKKIEFLQNDFQICDEHVRQYNLIEFQGPSAINLEEYLKKNHRQLEQIREKWKTKENSSMIDENWFFPV